MADPASQVNSLLRRPLYVFDLPPELLFSLSLAPTGNSTLPTAPETQPELDIPRGSASEDGAPQSTSCHLCKASFLTVQDQRNHVKSDFHRYNLKLSLKGMPSIDEATFIRMIGDLDESISGSDSSSSDEEDESSSGKDTTLSALLKRQAKLSPQNGEDDRVRIKKPVAGNAPLFWLSSPKIGQDDVLGVYKAIFTQAEQDTASQTLVENLKKKQLQRAQAKHSGNANVKLSPTAPSSDPHYFLCMIGGGHFAAMIVSLVPEIRKGPGGVEERHAVVRAHKTFHRYTTRRKQGGSQSANDNSKGNAHSAGSSIRRYNEAALETDVRLVLSEWKSMIDSAELLFIRATGVTNRRTLYGPYDGQILRNSDPRLRGFPFTTKRATQAELLRSFQELTRVKVSKLVEAASEVSKTEAPAPKTTTVKPAAPTLSKQEETAALHTSQLEALIRRSKAPGVLSYLTKNEISPNFHFFPASDNHHAPTPLHLSASTNSPALVTALLLKAKADPTVQNDDGKTAYDIAGDVKTRDAFRTARHQLGEDAFDWVGAAHVPTALSPEEAEAKTRQEKAASDAAEAQRRKTELEQIQMDEERRSVGRIEKKAGVGKTLAAVAEKTGAEKREEEARGLTPELRQRLERERRARAAEERMKRMQGGS